MLAQARQSVTAILMHWIAGGDHFFKPRERENLETAITASVRFITSV